ncbi:MAG: hypothetical protein Q7S43_02830 [bacterium]|nr:hypothetical protein [bacterium]MDO8496364.1 hypothetical protein [bacterium]
MEKIINGPNFIMPIIERETGEIERVGEEVFGNRNKEEFLAHFLKVAKTSSLVELSEDLWEKLENTDSHDIPLNDWSLVEEHAVNGNPNHPRDWQLCKKLYEEGDSIEAPIVVKKGNLLHLVSGNTRLMVARALGLTPKVLLVELDSQE